MLKIILKLSIFITGLLIITGCGGTTAAISKHAANTQNVSQLATKASVDKKIIITANGEKFQATLEQNSLTEKLIKSLPRTISMTPLAGSNQIYGDEPITVKSNLQQGMKKGTLAYCQYGYLILFYADQPASHTSSYVKVGEITSNLDKLEELSKGGSVRIEAVQDAISVTINGREVRGQLNSTPEAKAFQTMLPLKIKMTGFGGREYYGPIEKKLEVVSAGRLNFANGDITYCPTNNTVAIFYAQTNRPDLTMKVYTIGKITDDLSLFHDLNAEETVVFKME